MYSQFQYPVLKQMWTAIWECAIILVILDVSYGQLNLQEKEWIFVEYLEETSNSTDPWIITPIGNNTCRSPLGHLNISTNMTFPPVPDLDWDFDFPPLPNDSEIDNFPELNCTETSMNAIEFLVTKFIRHSV